MRTLDLPRNLRTRARREAPAHGPLKVQGGAGRRRGPGGLAGDERERAPIARDLKRFFFNYSHDTELDSANRVMIPPSLIEYGGLDREVVVVGSGECLEVFDRARYAGYSEDVLIRVPDIAAKLGHTA